MIGGLVVALVVVAVLLEHISGAAEVGLPDNVSTAAHDSTPNAPKESVEDAHRSLAVLLFNNMSRDEDLEWLRIGLAEILITDLAQVPDLEVVGIGRLYQSLEHLGYVDTPLLDTAALEAVAEATGVELLVVGGFARVGETLQIQVKLQDSSSGAATRTIGLAMCEWVGSSC